MSYSRTRNKGVNYGCFIAIILLISGGIIGFIYSSQVSSITSIKDIQQNEFCYKYVENVKCKKLISTKDNNIIFILSGKIQNYPIKCLGKCDEKTYDGYKAFNLTKQKGLKKIHTINKLKLTRNKNGVLICEEIKKLGIISGFVYYIFYKWLPYSIPYKTAISISYFLASFIGLSLIVGLGFLGFEADIDFD